MHRWTAPQMRGIWNRTNEYWKTRAQEALCDWGTKDSEGKRDSEVTAKIKTVQGASFSCRPLELIGSSPCHLPTQPHSIFVFTVTAEAMATKKDKARDHVHGPLTTRLHMSERLVRAAIAASFDTPTGAAPIPQLRHFLAPPLSLLGSSEFLVAREEYNAYWPSDTSTPVADYTALQFLLESGHNQADTLVLVAHQAYNYLGWVEWAKKMSKMSGNSSFGIGYMYVHPLYLFSRVDFNASFTVQITM
jgi:hypothetical protein